jgi:hypothetical protein
MIMNALVLAAVSVIAGAFLFLRLPLWLQRLIFRHSVIFDVLISLGSYFFFGGSATALLAAGILGLMVSGIFTLCHHFGIAPAAAMRSPTQTARVVTDLRRGNARYLARTVMKLLIAALGQVHRSLVQLQEKQQRVVGQRILPPLAKPKVLPPVTSDGK